MKNFILIIAIALCLIPFGVFGATITVINNNDSGTGSLRQAISDAVGGDEIVFNLGSGNETITLSLGQLTIDKNLTIDGSNSGGSGVNVTIDGNNLSRVFNITGGPVDLSNLTIQNGNGNEYGKGGGILIDESVTASISDCAITGNSIICSSSGDGSGGGGIYNKGTLSISNSTISYNTATTVLDQIEGSGGGIYNAQGSSLTIDACTISNNQVIHSEAATFVSTGGGISSSGTLTITNSTISFNSAIQNYYEKAAYGAGIYVWDGDLTTIKNSTISNNSISTNNHSATGVGLLLYGDLILENSTISQNGNSGIEIYAAGLYFFGNGKSMTIRNTIIAQNINNSNSYDYGIDYIDGSITDNGYNVIEYSYVAANAAGGLNNATSILYNTKYNDGGTEYSGWTQGGTAVSGSLELSGTLALNNSTNGTYTLALGTSSFAAGSRTTGIPPASNWNGSPQIDGSYTDQRGVERTANQNTSIGAYSENYTLAPMYCLDFDGANDYANCGSINLSGSAITLECWVNVDNFQSSSPYISQIMGTESGSNSAFLRLGDGDIPAGNKIEFALNIGGQQQLTSNSTLETGRWYHIAGVYDGTNMKIYINGVEDASVAKPGSFTSNSTFYIATWDGAQRYLDGKVDEARIWTVARSSTDLNNNMCHRLAGNESGLTAYYRFDDGTSTTLTDATANSHNGTLYNMDNADWVNSYAMVITEDASNITFNGFTANWDCPAEANSSFDDGYTIQYSTTSDFTSGNATTSALISETSKAITGLTDNTTYYYRVSGKRSGSGILEYSNTKSLTTTASSAPEYALDFDGSNDYVDCGTINLSGSAITLECWVNVDVFQAGSPYISQLIGTESAGNSAFLRLGDADITAGNKIEFALQIGAGVVQLTSISTLETGRWYHIAGVYDGSNMKIYIDGAEDASVAQSGSFTSNSDFYIASNDGSGRYLDGRVDEVRVWNDARTPTEIQNNMCSRLAGTEDNLLAYYRFDNGSGTTLSDVTTNGHNGTLHNMDNADWINSYAMVITEDATDVTDDSFTANWACPASSSSSYDDGYTIQYSTTSDFSSGNATTTALVSETSKAITGLSASTTYYYRVSGKRSGSGTLEYSNVKSFTTDAAYAPKYALDFERDNSQYANCGNINLSGSAITLECWIKPESFQTGSPYISQIMGTESGTNSAFLRLGDGDIPAGNKIQFVLYFSGGQEKVTSTSTLETGRWYHIAGVYDGSNMKIYINGVEDVSNSQTGSFTSNSTFYIAAYNGSDRYFDGTVDEVRVWKTARSSTDINTYMTTLLNGNETNLEAYYRCDNGSGTALSDITSNGHNASLVNTPSWPNSYAMVIADDATDVTDDSFTANWSCPAEANSSYDDGYTIQYSTTSDFSSGNATATASTSATSTSISGLSASTTYYYRVSGKRSGNATLEYSNVKSVTTSAPPAPEYCLDFDGTGDYVSINSTMGLGVTNVTIEAWVYIPSTTASGTIARLGNNNSGFGIGVGNGDFDNDGNELLVLIDTKRWIDPNVSIGTGWHHVAFSVGATNGVKIYLNGVNIHSEDSHGTAAVAPNTLSFIGTANVSNYRIFSGGKIDEVRYWGDVRTGTEIQNNMCSRLAGNEDNLAAYYRFDNGSGTTLYDATASPNNGSLQGDPTWTPSYAMVIAEDATVLAENSFTANWSCIAEANSSFDGYRIEYSENQDFSASSTVDALVSETSKSITGLSNSTTYYYRVGGIRSSSVEYSNVKTATTTGSFSTVVTSNLDNGGTSTLRYIIANCADGATITFNLGSGNEVITLDTEDIDITKSLTIDGDNTSGSGTNVTVKVNNPNTSEFRVFNITSNAGTVSIDNMTVRGGNISALSNTVSNCGGCVFIDDADSVLFNNVTFSDGKAVDGGGIYTNSSIGNPISTIITITGCSISNNSCTEYGGGVYLGYSPDATAILTGCNISNNICNINGGGISNRMHKSTLKECVISNNTATGNGGGMEIGYGPSIIDCTISDNSCSGQGGGITVHGPLDIKGCTIENNYSSYCVGAIFRQSGSSDDVHNITNCTIHGNYADNMFGAMIIPTGKVYINNTTITANYDQSGYGGLYLISGASLYITNSIIAYNYTIGNNYSDFTYESGTIYGNYNIIGGYDLSGSNNTNYSYSNGLGSDLFESYTTISENTIYKPVLADNGGNTETVALASNSIALADGVRTGEYDDNGTTKYVFHNGTNWVKVEDGSTIVSSGVTEITTDQRGFPRDESSPTIGAFAAVSSLVVVSNEDDNSPGTLRYVYNNCSDGDEITFNLSSGNETITLTSELSITKSLTIDGSNTSGSGTPVTIKVTAPGTSTYRVFKIDASGKTIALSNMTINGGDVSSLSWDVGGGIFLKAGSLSLDFVNIDGAEANYGGGIYIHGGATITTLSNSTISGNSAYFGGGIFIHSNATLTSLINSTICGNTISSDGGGIYINENATLTTLSNTTINGNTSSAGTGGGIYLQYGGVITTLSNSTISGNTALNGGCGIAVDGTITIQNTIIADNTTQDYYLKNQGSTTNNGYNIVENSNYTFNATGDITGEQANLFGTGMSSQSLSDNGGPTQTLAIESGSVAIAAGSYDSNIPTDQRGKPRHNPISTIGAYEFDSYDQVWTGSSSSSWSNAANWNPASIPVSTDDITIPEISSKASTLAIGPTETADCKNLTVDNNGNLTIQSTSAGTGSLIINGTLSNSGTITSQSYLPGSAQAWHMFSSPAVCDISDNGWNPGANDDFFAWLETSPGTWINYKNITTSPTFDEVNGNDFVAGKGYLTAWNSGNPTKYISGTLNTGNINFPLAYTSAKSWSYNSGWNLMGNPYSSSIDWSLADLSKFQDNYAYIYNPNKGEGGGFITVDGGAADAFIPPHQGFFAVATEAANEQNFTFSPAMQTHGNSSHIYKEKEAENSIVLILKAAQYYDETKIRIDSRSTWKRDRYDALKLFSYNTAVPQLYSLADDDISLAINGIPEAQSRDYMPLGLLLPEADHYEIALLSAEGSFAPAEILLEDKNTGTRHKLESGSYHFNGEEGINEDRFVLHFKEVTGIEDISENTNFNIWQQGDQIILQGDTEIKRITLTDITGRILGVWESTENIPAPSTAGVYLVTVETDHNRITKKIIIK